MGRERATFTVDAEILRELDSVAKELETTRSGLVEKSLLYFFDYLDVRLAEKRLADKKDAVIPAEKVWEELGL
jgi:predicted transcriptional regulator